jgi:hypothetical protein
MHLPPPVQLLCLSFSLFLSSVFFSLSPLRLFFTLFAPQSTFDDHPFMTYIHSMKAIQKDKKLALFVPPEHKKCELRKGSSSNIWEQLEPERTPSSLTGNIIHFHATICENLLLSEGLISEIDRPRNLTLKAYCKLAYI